MVDLSQDDAKWVRDNNRGNFRRNEIVAALTEITEKDTTEQKFATGKSRKGRITDYDFPLFLF